MWEIGAEAGVFQGLRCGRCNQGERAFMVRAAGRRFGLLLLISSFLAMSPVPGVAQSAPGTPEPLTADPLVARMVEKNAERASALESYEGRRSYSLNYVGFPTNLHADMTVSMVYKAPATKEF